MIALKVTTLSHLYDDIMSKSSSCLRFAEILRQKARVQ